MQPPHCLDRLAALLHAHRTQVPMTANCQYFAVVEALHRVRVQNPHTTCVVVDRTRQLKHVIAHTFQRDSDLETRFCNVDLLLERSGSDILDTFEDPNAHDDDTPARAWLLKYFGMLAQSDSQLNSVLPDFLWGGLDTLRLASKFLDRRIFIASKPTFDFDGPLHLLTIQPDVGVGTSVIKIPEWREWLVGLNDEFDQGRFPLVLALEVEHYSSVLMSAPINVDQVYIQGGESEERDTMSSIDGDFDALSRLESTERLSDGQGFSSAPASRHQSNQMPQLEFDLKKSIRQNLQKAKHSRISAKPCRNHTPKDSLGSHHTKRKTKSMVRKKCSVPDCSNNAVTKGKCRSHGGGRRCFYPQCDKAAQSRSFFCWAHGGGQRCEALGCMRSRSTKKASRFCSIHHVQYDLTVSIR